MISPNISKIMAVTDVYKHIIYQQQLAWIWQQYKSTILLLKQRKQSKFNGLVKYRITNKKTLEVADSMADYR